MTTNRNWVEMVKIQVRSGLFTTASRTRMRSRDQVSVCIEFLPLELKKKWGRRTVSENSRVVYTPISINFMGSQELGLQGNPPTVYQTDPMYCSMSVR